MAVFTPPAEDPALTTRLARARCVTRTGLLRAGLVCLALLMISAARSQTHAQTAGGSEDVNSLIDRIFGGDTPEDTSQQETHEDQDGGGRANTGPNVDAAGSREGTGSGLDIAETTSTDRVAGSSETTSDPSVTGSDDLIDDIFSAAGDPDSVPGDAAETQADGADTGGAIDTSQTVNTNGASDASTPLSNTLGETQDTIQDTLIRIGELLPSIRTLIQVFAGALGLGYGIQGLYRGAAIANGTAGPRRPHHAAFTVLAGIFLFFLAQTIDIVIFGIFEAKSTTASLAYQDATEGLSERGERSFQALVGLINVIGIIAILRGVIIIKRTAGGDDQQATVLAGIVFLVAGGLAANILQTVDILGVTFDMFST